MTGPKEYPGGKCWGPGEVGGGTGGGNLGGEWKDMCMQCVHARKSSWVGRGHRVAHKLKICFTCCKVDTGLPVKTYIHTYVLCTSYAIQRMYVQLSVRSTSCSRSAFTR